MQDDNKYLIPLNIDGSIKQIQTKATAQGFVDKDAVGLFAVNYSENNTIAGVLQTSGNQADNVKYVFDEPNHKWNPVRPVYYKNINTHADLYLYYPYQGTITDVNSANFEVQKDQSAAATATSLSGYEASDWMWGKGEDITPSESKVQIQLTHRLSAVQVSLTEGSGFESGEFESLEKIVILSGTTRKATLDYATGSSTPVGSAQLDGIIMCPQSDGSWRAVVIPQTVAAGTKLFSLTIGGTAYSYSQDTAIEFQVGKQMNVSLTINKKSLSGDYELLLGSTQIVDWTEDQYSHGGEARQYYVVNLSAAGSLQSAIEAAGKNPAKIRSIIIIGPVNEDDFYFMRDNMEILAAVNMKESVVSKIPEKAFQNSTLAYYTFPDSVVEIGDRAFQNSHLSGALIIPNNVSIIGVNAFEHTLIGGSIDLPKSIKIIRDGAFAGNNGVSGQLLLPEGIISIEGGAFAGCNLSGHIHLPNSLEYIGAGFIQGSFTGDLTIPEKIHDLEPGLFRGATFTGRLSLSNVKHLASGAFEDCYFRGELIIPEGITTIPAGCFKGNSFSNIVLPSTLTLIEEGGFEGNEQWVGPVNLPDGLVAIKDAAFLGCRNLIGVAFPSSLRLIGRYAFSNCFYISSLTCKALEPPTALENAFYGISKKSFTLEVPSQSIKRYQAEPEWNEFERVGAHFDFSISRQLIQGINAERSLEMVLYAPSGFDWSIQSKPEWVSVSPSSGIGKTAVTITISAMSRTDNTFEINEGTFNNPNYKTYQGRKGEIVFWLNDKDYTSSLAVEQYDTDEFDGKVRVLQTHSQGSGIDIVFVGDGYSSRDIAKGVFDDNVTDGYEHFFAVEPYKTYKDYFNVYSVTAVSNDSGVGTANKLIDNRYGSSFTKNRLFPTNADGIFEWAQKAKDGIDFSKSLVILLLNTSFYAGQTLMYSDGSALACCPVSTDLFPFDFRGLIQHEAGGHGFGKLADEYIYHNAPVSDCPCTDGCEHPQSDVDTQTTYGVMKSLGWYRNLSMSADPNKVPWSHLIFNPQYSDYVDVFEGGYMHNGGIYRSEVTSCMNNNIPYFSAISRQAIVERIKFCAGEEFSLEEFYLNDKDDFGPVTRGVTVSDRTFGVDPNYVKAVDNSPILVGNHPRIN